MAQYRTKYENTDLLGWTDELRKLEDIYTDGIMTKVERTRKNKMGKDQKEWERYDNNTDDNNTVSLDTGNEITIKDWAIKENLKRRTIIQGDAGIGKSMSLKRLCLDWVNQENKSYLLLLVPLRDLQRECKDIVDILLQIGLIPIDEFKEDEIEFIKEYVRVHQEEVCILFDGFDQLSTSLHSCVLRFWKGNQLRNVPMMMTTRKEQAHLLGAMHSDIQHLEVNGFDENRKRNLIMVYFFRCPELAENATEVLINNQESGNNTQSLTNNPFNLILMCLLIEERGGSMPQTKTKLLEETILSFIKKQTKMTRPSNSGGSVHKILDTQTLTSLPSDTHATLLKLAEFAFRNLMLGKYNFSSSEGLLIEPDQSSQHFGLLTCRTSSSFNQPGNEWYFVHALIQEFLCAYWIVYTQESRGVDLLEDISTLGENISFYQYACGLMGGRAAYLLKQLLLKQNLSITTEWLHSLHDACFYSSDDRSLRSCQQNNTSLYQELYNCFQTVQPLSIDLTISTFTHVILLLELVAHDPSHKMWQEICDVIAISDIDKDISKEELILIKKAASYIKHIPLVNVLVTLRQNPWIKKIIPATTCKYMNSLLRVYNHVDWQKCESIDIIANKQILALSVLPGSKVEIKTHILEFKSPDIVKFLVINLCNNITLKQLHDSTALIKGTKYPTTNIEILFVRNQSALRLLSGETFHIHPHLKYIAIVCETIDSNDIEYLVQAARQHKLQLLVIITTQSSPLGTDIHRILIDNVPVLVVVSKEGSIKTGHAIVDIGDNNKLWRHIEPDVSNVVVQTDDAQHGTDILDKFKNVGFLVLSIVKTKIVEDESVDECLRAAVSQIWQSFDSDLMTSVSSMTNRYRCDIHWPVSLADVRQTGRLTALWLMSLQTSIDVNTTNYTEHKGEFVHSEGSNTDERAVYNVYTVMYDTLSCVDDIKVDMMLESVEEVKILLEFVAYKPDHVIWRKINDVDIESNIEDEVTKDEKLLIDRLSCYALEIPLVEVVSILRHNLSIGRTFIDEESQTLCLWKNIDWCQCQVTLSKLNLSQHILSLVVWEDSTITTQRPLVELRPPNVVTFLRINVNSNVSIVHTEKTRRMIPQTEETSQVQTLQFITTTPSLIGIISKQTVQFHQHLKYLGIVAESITTDDLDCLLETAKQNKLQLLVLATVKPLPLDKDTQRILASNVPILVFLNGCDGSSHSGDDEYTIETDSKLSMHILTWFSKMIDDLEMNHKTVIQTMDDTVASVLDLMESQVEKGVSQEECLIVGLTQLWGLFTSDMRLLSLSTQRYRCDIYWPVHMGLPFEGLA